MININDFKYYLITIERSKEHRKENIENITQYIKENTGKSVTQYGIDGNLINESFIKTMKKIGFFKNSKGYRKTDKKILSFSEIGCFLSHVKVWLNIVKYKIPFALVFEDDALIDYKTFITDLEKILKHTPNYIEFISFFHFHSDKQKSMRKKLTKYNNHLLKIRFDLYGTTCYIISYQGAKNFLKKLLPISNPVDRAIMYYFYTHRNKSLGCISKKPLAGRFDDKSFIKN